MLLILFYVLCCDVVNEERPNVCSAFSVTRTAKSPQDSIATPPFLQQNGHGLGSQSYWVFQRVVRPWLKGLCASIYIFF
jgi:hypothetical protein